MDDMYIGRFLDDRYEILEKIGSGGMAVVYKSLDHRLNRFVAIKILKSDLAQDPDLRRRFHAESQAVAMLSHPNIVSVYDVNHSENVDYIVMELIEGITLKQYINRKGILNWKEALHFTTQIAKALEHAHSRGIIHRDIKPHNIMILKDGNVKVADFGIARLLTTQNTLTQETLGSVHYISPEQAKGGAADARSDIYSVGVVMYEMLTSRLPFEGESAVSIAIQHINSIPLMPREINPDIPVGLEEITMRAMSPNLSTRYQSATELLADLEDFRKNPSVRFNYSFIPSLADDTRTIPVKAINEAERARRRVSGNGMTRTRTTPEEYRENRRRSGRTSMMVCILCVAVLIIGIVVVMWKGYLKDWIIPQDDDVPISVPNFVGSMFEDVTSNQDYLKYYRFESPKYDFNSDRPAGYILNQDPVQGRSVTPTESKIPVTLTIAAGKDPLYMPDLVNKDHREAANQMENMGFKVEEDYRYDENITEGYVIETVPAANEPITEGMTIYITYSLGPEVPMVKVPSIVSYTEETALSLLERQNLVGKKLGEEYNEEYSAGRIFLQDTEKDTEVPEGTEIGYYISLGPEPDEPDDSGNEENPGGNTNPGGWQYPGGWDNPGGGDQGGNTNPGGDNQGTDPGVDNPTYPGGEDNPGGNTNPDDSGQGSGYPGGYVGGEEGDGEMGAPGEEGQTSSG